MPIHCLKLQPPAEQRARVHRPSALSGFTLVEVLISILVVGVSLGGVLSLYVQSAIRSDWSATSVSAQMMALSGMEQCRAATYDPRGQNATDSLQSTNFPQKVDILDIGTSSGVITYGTNTTTVSTVSANPMLKMVRVDCVWAFPRKGLFTNSVTTYRAPSQ